MKKEKEEKKVEKDIELEKNNEATTEEIDEVTKYKQLADGYLDKMQRTLAEFDNFRKRTAKEKATMYEDGIRDAVLQILPVVDNFERALQSTAEKDNSFYKGIEMILKQLEGILADIGVTEIAALGEQFDPALHAAVAHTEDETLGENTVAEVLLKGYRFKEKVIRHSMVKVVN